MRIPMNESYNIKLARNLVVGDKIIVYDGEKNDYLEIKVIKKTKTVIKVFLEDTSYSYRPNEDVVIL